MAQAGTLYRYVRADSDFNISGDVFAISVDGGVTFTSAGVSYIAPGALPARIAAVDIANAPLSGLTGYWFRFLSGPGTSFQLATGDNTVRGKATDNPQIPYFAWLITVAETD